jgi:formylglycine-generating enzyme required for sulfatase activity
VVRADSALALAALCLACDAPPRGEALLVVDTDMPVPKIVDHLRVDIYSADGSEWWVSRDIALLDPEEWPVSFSVFSDDTSAASSALVRLRAYPSGYVDDYHGEGPVTLPALGTQWVLANYDSCCSSGCSSVCREYWAPIGDCATPPCLLGGNTPPTEPQPLVTIDRLVRVDLVPGVRGKAAVLLAGKCEGTPAVLPDPARANPSPDDITTCEDTERVLVPVSSASPLDPDMTLPPRGSSVQGAFEKPFQTDCPALATPTQGLFDDEVCVRGGVMIFGDNSRLSAASDAALPRVAAVPTFVIDRYEYSVARFEAAVANGFVPSPSGLAINDGPLDYTGNTLSECTAYLQSSWGSPDRDARAINCVRNPIARALCQREGRDLPLEVQWEYAASAAGRPTKDFITYPTASGPIPQCTDVAYARAAGGANACFLVDPSYLGVAHVDFGNDVADQLGGGIVGMTGNVSESMLDAAAPMGSNCILSAPITSPSCLVPTVQSKVNRGAVWYNQAEVVSTALRYAGELGLDPGGGFRCAR